MIGVSLKVSKTISKNLPSSHFRSLTMRRMRMILTNVSAEGAVIS